MGRALRTLYAHICTCDYLTLPLAEGPSSEPDVCPNCGRPTRLIPQTAGSSSDSD